MPSPTVTQISAPALVAGRHQAAWYHAGSGTRLVTPAEARSRVRETPPVVCDLVTTAQRLDAEPFPALDLLELFAFVRPARFVTPTPRGLAAALGLEPPARLEEMPGALVEAARALLAECAARGEGDRAAAATAWAMARAGWPWGPALLSVLGAPAGRVEGAAALRVWEGLPDWSDEGPEPPPGSQPIEAGEARRRLAEVVGEDAEARPEQADYASAASLAFAPRDEKDRPNLVLAQAGTGVGKTLGYLAPADVWAERNRGPVWISTFTRNLQHQIDRELDRFYPEPSAKAARVVVRKGRENYLCLLNLDEAVRALPARPQGTTALGLMARWAARSRDGDMVGGDFPGWLPHLLGRAPTLGLADRRGECVYSACPHYGKCFIERGVRRARRARFVIANHALVMIHAALGGDDGARPGHVVFDEGHHLFDAADSAFSAHLSGREAQDLRRWLIGAESGSRGGSGGGSRLRGLRRRIEDLLVADSEGKEALDELLRAAERLPGEGWLQRLAEGAPRGTAEAFLMQVRAQVYARTDDPEGPYGLEAEVRPALPGLLEAAEGLARALAALIVPMQLLEQRLAARLDEDAEHLDSDLRRRLEATARGLERRRLGQAAAWKAMLDDLADERPPEVVDWLAVERIEGRVVDLGFYRHWVDPTRPFAEAVLKPAQGALVTSATLTDRTGDPEQDWPAAERRSGAVHLDGKTVRADVPSPFDYAGRTRVFVIEDLGRDDAERVASAYRALFLAAGGGALGLFTAISRLRRVHARIARPLEDAGLALYAQHVDRLDVSSLVEIFRTEEDSCLLGTDAVRDGVDVPGRSLRLIVFDRVPWPRPTILHRARREAFGGRRYDDTLTRLKLTQAYGRLLRRQDDRGVFVLLDRKLPSRLQSAFPPDVAVQRLGLAEAVAETARFLAPGADQADPTSREAGQKPPTRRP